jgi:hypothetical protein
VRLRRCCRSRYRAKYRDCLSRRRVTHVEQTRGNQAATTEVAPDDVAVHPTHLLSNGRYCVALRASGAGWSQLGEVSIFRAGATTCCRMHTAHFLLKRADASPCFNYRTSSAG